MKLNLKIVYYWKKMLVKLHGSTMLNTNIRDEIAIKFIESIWNKSITGNRVSNTLLYDTMFIIYLPQDLYNISKNQLKGIVSSTALELEFILKNNINPSEFPNYNTPHSPYWQFFFQAVPEGAQVPGLKEQNSSKKIGIKSEDYPVGRNATSNQTDGQKISIRSKKSKGNGNLLIDKNAFKKVEQISEGEFAVPFGVLNEEMVAQNFSRDSIGRLEIFNSSFLINGAKNKAYEITSSEFYIGGKNSQTTYKGQPVICIDNHKVMNPHVHISYSQGFIYVKAIGDASYLNQKIGNSGIKILKGSSIVINDSIQIVFS